MQIIGCFAKYATIYLKSQIFILIRSFLCYNKRVATRASTYE